MLIDGGEVSLKGRLGTVRRVLADIQERRWAVSYSEV
jgi:hypothetical protein